MGLDHRNVCILLVNYMRHHLVGCYIIACGMRWWHRRTRSTSLFSLLTLQRLSKKFVALFHQKFGMPDDSYCRLGDAPATGARLDSFRSTTPASNVPKDASTSITSEHFLHSAENGTFWSQNTTRTGDDSLEAISARLAPRVLSAFVSPSAMDFSSSDYSADSFQTANSIWLASDISISSFPSLDGSSRI